MLSRTVVHLFMDMDSLISQNSLKVCQGGLACMLGLNCLTGNQMIQIFKCSEWNFWSAGVTWRLSIWDSRFSKTFRNDSCCQSLSDILDSSCKPQFLFYEFNFLTKFLELSLFTKQEGSALKGGGLTPSPNFFDRANFLQVSQDKIERRLGTYH